jgi:CheY-like chemotaxis protein
LRNPLAPIRNGLQILRVQASTDQLSQRTLEMMQRQMAQVVRLVDDLLDVSHIARGNLPLRREQILLDEVLTAAIESSRSLIESRAHRLDLDMRASSPIRIAGDRSRLMQVFCNLLSNSCKYTDPAGTITVTLECEADEAVVRVRDTGIGIPANALDAVFEMFSQVQPDDARGDRGLGIGLSLVRSLVVAHGGSVSAASQGVGKGSSFTVRLPIARSNLLEVGSHRAITEQPSIERPLQLLVVDDNADAAMAFAALLELGGHRVQTAANGLEAIEKVQKLALDVIFMDVSMPGMDGLEAARRIRALPQGGKIDIVAVTGWAQQSDRDLTRQAGMNHHLAKPISEEALRAVLENTSTRRGADNGAS